MEGLIKPFKTKDVITGNNKYKDLNNATEYGIYSGTTPQIVANTPDGFPVLPYILLVYGYSTDRIVQTIISSSGKIATRSYIDTWSNWVYV